MDRKPESELSNQEVAEGIVQRIWDRIKGTSQESAHPATQREDHSHLTNQQVAEHIVQRWVDRFSSKTQDQATEQSANRSGADNGLDVQSYVKSVIDTAQANSQTQNVVVAAHAVEAQEQGRATAMDAAKLANTAIRQYEGYREKGLGHDEAREQVAREIGERFNERAQDTQRQERQLSQGQSM